MFKNSQEIYDNIAEDRDVNYFLQYNSPKFQSLTQEQMVSLTIETKIWTIGDRLYKLAAQYYNDPTYWWVIAQFNQKPTESHFKVGDSVYIPLPRELIFTYYRV